MKIRILEKNVESVSVVFLPVNQFDPSVPASDDLRIVLPGVVRLPYRHHEGYIIFLDLPPGDYPVSIESVRYKYYGELAINPLTQDPLNAIVELPVEPSADYPFPNDATLLRGIVQDSYGNPIQGARVEIDTGGQFAISDAQGRVVLYFDQTADSADYFFNVTGDNWFPETVSAPVLKNQTTSFTVQLISRTDPNLATIDGSVVSAYGDPITQALVEVVEYNEVTRTDIFGICSLFLQLPSSPETVNVRISQIGYKTETFPLMLTTGETTGFTKMLQTDSFPHRVELKVDVEDYSGPIAGSLVEVIEKDRAALTNTDGRVLMYFEMGSQYQKETVHIRASLEGYQERTREVELKAGSLRIDFFLQLI